MKDRGGGVVDAVGLAQRVILVDGGVEGAGLYESANLVHFRGGENGSDSAVHIAALFPLFLILEERLFHGLDFAKLGGGTCVASGYPRVRVHGEREIAVDQVDLAAGDVIVHQPAIGGGGESLASRALVVAEDFHDDRRILRAECFVRISVGETTRLLPPGRTPGSFSHTTRTRTHSVFSFSPAVAP